MSSMSKGGAPRRPQRTPRRDNSSTDGYKSQSSVTSRQSQAHHKSQRTPHKHRGSSKASPQSDPQAEWRQWRELTVRLDGLPPDVTPQLLWQWFSAHGAVVWIDIFKRGTGRSNTSARIRFEPPPKRAFWASGKVTVQHPNVRRHPQGLPVFATMSEERPRRWLIGSKEAHQQAHQRKYPVKMTIGLEQLDFGSMIGPKAMMAMKSIFPTPQSGSMKMEIDVKNKWLTVYFPTVVDKDDWQELREFRFQVDISSIKNLHQTTTADGSTVWVLPLQRPPQYFWKMDDVEASFIDRPTIWSFTDLWFRATDIANDPSLPMKHPVAVHNEIDDPGYMEIGRWTTFRLVISQQKEMGCIDSPDLMRMALEDFNVTVHRSDAFEVREAGKTMWDFLDHSPVATEGNASALLELSASPVIHLPFEVRYQLEVCVSRGILNEHTVTVDFLQRLASLKPFDATRRLEYLVDQGEPMYDPMELFKHPDAEAYIPNLKTPHYCTLVRKAVITPTTIRYNSPTVETSNRVMRKYSHIQDRFLRVQFIEEAEQGRIAINKTQNDEIWKRIFRALYQGIRIGDRVYEFLGFGSSQLRQCGVYFFCPTEHISCDDIRKWMGHFSHIRVVAKYAARLGQCFSTTREIRGIFRPAVKAIADIERDGYCFTDGVGRISRFLARLIIEEMTLDVFDEPTAFQFRMGGCKGVLAVWPQAQGMEVHVRHSQEKFKAVANGLEIIRCAKFSTATLNRQTITILECLGVPTGTFVNLLNQQIQEYQKAMRDNSVAVGLLTKFVDENQSTLILAELLKAGFRNEDVQEPFTLNLLNLWRSWSLKLLKEKARIQVEKSAFVLGCVDETGTLRGHSVATEGSKNKDVNKLPQIFLQLSDPNRYDETIIVKGVCIVGRNPSLHPGDIRVVQAVDNPLLHHLKDVVVFASTGDRPVPNMLSGGDLDGDDFFVIWDPNLIPTEWNFPPMSYTPSKPLELQRDVEVNDIRDFFVKYMKNDVLPLIATAHLAHCDQEEGGPKSQKCLNLAELHSKAVDFPKTGDPAEWVPELQPKRWPHFMDKRSSYPSTKTLGVLYNKVSRHTIEFEPDWEHTFDQRILSRYQLGDDLLQTARAVKQQYDLSVRRVLAQHDVATEFELYSGWSMSRPAIGTDYKRQEDLGREYDAIKTRFRELCYEAAGGSDDDKLDKFVAAMYKVTEEEAMVALYEPDAETDDVSDEAAPNRHQKPRVMPLISFPWIFHWVLIRIASGGQYQPKKSLLAAFRRKAQGHSDSAVRHPTDVEKAARTAADLSIPSGSEVGSSATFLDGDDLISFGTLDEFDMPLTTSGDESGLLISSPGGDSVASLLDAPPQDEPSNGATPGGDKVIVMSPLRDSRDTSAEPEQVETQSRQEIDFFDEDDDADADDDEGRGDDCGGDDSGQGKEDSGRGGESGDEYEKVGVSDMDGPADEREVSPAMDRVAALIGFDEDD